MKSAARVVFIVLCLSVVAFFAYLKSGAMPVFAQTAPATGATAKEACLKCHGPYDKLVGRSGRVCCAERREDKPPRLRSALVEGGESGPGVHELPPAPRPASEQGANQIAARAGSPMVLYRLPP